MLQQFGRSLLDGRLKKVQTHRDIRIHVGHFHKQLPNGQADIQFFPAFPAKSLRMTFSGFHLAAYEFPKQTPGLVGRSLADHKPVFLPDQRCHHFRYIHISTHFFRFFEIIYQNAAECNILKKFIFCLTIFPFFGMIEAVFSITPPFPKNIPKGGYYAEQTI